MTWEMQLSPLCTSTPAQLDRVDAKGPHHTLHCTAPQQSPSLTSSLCLLCRAGRDLYLDNYSNDCRQCVRSGNIDKPHHGDDDGDDDYSLGQGIDSLCLPRGPLGPSPLVHDPSAFDFHGPTRHRPVYRLAELDE